MQVHQIAVGLLIGGTHADSLAHSVCFVFIWLNMMKIVDELHIKNHVNLRCQQYHPNIVRETIPDMNTMACEQTFAQNGAETQ